MYCLPVFFLILEYKITHYLLLSASKILYAANA
jgi:hypothetical protein